MFVFLPPITRIFTDFVGDGVGFLVGALHNYSVDSLFHVCHVEV